MKRLTAKKIVFFAFIGSCFVSLVFAKIILNLPEEYEDIWIKRSNLHSYLIMLILAVITFLGMSIVLTPLKSKLGTRDFKFSCPIWKQGVIIAIPVVLVLGIFLHWLCINQFTEFAQRLDEQPFFAIPRMVAVSLFVFGIILAFSMIVRKSDISTFSLYVIYAFCLIIYFFSLYYVNIFKTDLHHGIAVLESIFNVCDLVPFSYATTGIYGHYGLFFLVPMRMSGGSMYVAASLLAFSGCISAIAFFYVCHFFLPNNWLRAIFACAMIVFVSVFSRWHYWQLYPIRIFFPMILCAYVCFISKRTRERSNSNILVGYILSSLAIIWNTESGIFCLAAFSIYIIAGWLQIYKWYEKNMCFVYIKVLLFCAFSILIAVGVVNIYNFICGGGYIFKAFFFPLFSKSYIDVVSYDMVWGNHAWVYVFVLLMAMLAWGLYHTRLFKKKEEIMNKNAPIAILVAVLGLLSFSYYANRAAWGNLGICYGEILIVNALIIKETWNSLNDWRNSIDFEEVCRKALAIISITVVVSLGVHIPLSFIRLSGDLHQDNVLTTDSIASDMGVMVKDLPENIYGVGKGISILYHMLGWDNYARVRDFSDLLVGGSDAIDAVIDELLQQDSFLLSSNEAAVLVQLSFLDRSYMLVDSYTVQGTKFYYYQRSKDSESANWLQNYMRNLLKISEACEKNTDEEICIHSEQYISGSGLYLKEGKYILKVIADGELELSLKHYIEEDIFFEQHLNAGENQIPFLLTEEARLIIEIHNVGQEEVLLTEICLEKEK